MANILLSYQYHLTNVNWTNDYDNVLNFYDKAARNTYFDLADIFDDPNYNLFNFNISNLYKTTIVIDCSDYITAMQSNYLIVKNKTKSEYYFYFITNCKQTNFNRVELSIELDIFQQYYYDVEFVDAPINRCRYPLNEENNLFSPSKLVLKDDNIVYNAEDVNAALKYLKTMTPANNISTAENDIANNLYGWMYVFVDPTHAFECKDWDDAAATVEISGYTTKPDKTHGIYNNIGVLAFPIYSGSKPIQIEASTTDDTYYIQLTDAANILEQLKAGNSGADAAYIYSIKISRRIPLSKEFIDNNYLGMTPTILQFSCTCNDSQPCMLLIDPISTTAEVGVIKIGAYYGLRVINDSMQNYEYKYVWTNSEIVAGASSCDPSTKLMVSQYTQMYVDFGDGNKMQYDYNKAFFKNAYGQTIQRQVTLLYKEAITPDVSRYSASFHSVWYDGTSDDSMKYANETFTSDMTLIFTLDQWSDYIANNKNFYAQGNFNTMMKINKEVMSGLSGAALLNPIGAAKAAATMYADSVQFAKNREFQVDNIKSSVDRVINQNGNACFNLITHGIQPALVMYQIPSDDKTRILKYLKMYGVNTVGLIGNIKDYDGVNLNAVNTDSNFHYAYIQSDVNELKSGTISLECEKALLQIFNKGTRMWSVPEKMYNFNY